MARLYLINGPNLNLLGRREPEIYGSTTFEQFFEGLQQRFPEVELHYFQSNHEGELLDHLHAIGFSADGIILNAGAYTHTSVALHDALKAISSPTVEVHISAIHKREAFRHKSLIAPACVGMISGLGLEGYALAIQYFLNQLQS
ncbi:3-dehydroquinate dehydratase [Nitritalea halalkaliphila LW7]|uniref:3-dehydroquinate dehydratase n=1 Tax=Nitritalea halalkaliphila LW7 TaxID=1189621 RepID=I5BZ09_9BACT|nr:type II 3-dehydroquinate dehydratase [Nitritalea halalkaliphila]EIM74811.1 3-dehydroquinate dehydratase [Nitritalea halalkaliphila LW7]